MHFLIVAAVLSDYPDLNQRVQDAVDVAQLESLKSFWLSTGLLSPTESKFDSVWTMQIDLEVMYRRLEQITDDLPPAEDAHRFPPQSAYWDVWRLTEDFLKYLDDIEPYAVGEELADIVALRWDTERRKDIWQLATSLNGGWVGDEGVRARLKELRTKIGEADYQAGVLPHPLPDAAQTGTWRAPR